MNLEYLNYESADYIINQVKEELYSYDSAGLIDDGMFYSWIKDELQSFGLGLTEEKEEILDVKNYKLKVPADFVNLYSIARCTFLTKGVHTLRVKTEPAIAYIESCHTSIKKAPCKGYEYFGDIIRKQVHIEFQVPDKTSEIEEYQFKGLLRWTNRVSTLKMCGEDCVNTNISQPNEFSLTSSHFFFNFTDDSVHLRYYALKVDENGLPMIPDLVEVRKSIETLLIYKLFRLWYNNGEGDVQQRMLLAKQDYEKAHADARKARRIDSFQQLIEYGMSKKKKNNIFEIRNKASQKLR